MDSEIWKEIAGTNGLYQISNYGNVRSMPKKNVSTGRKMGNNIKPLFDKRSGYYTVLISYSPQKRIKKFIHRLVCEAFHSNPESKPTINHKDSIRINNFYKNLEWATHSENNKHAWDFGNQVKKFGEDHPGSKLNRQKVFEIRSKFQKHKYTMPMLAAEYGVTKSAIQSVLSFKSWKP